jgi:NADPH:quinone reductase-like Zn-dependent oxidoreductase
VRRAPPHLYRRHLPHPLDRVREIFESRKLQLPIGKVFAFEDIGKLFEYMEANKHLGKIVARL